MPIYIYKHPKKNKVKELVQSVKDKHEYIDEHGVRWERIFTSPQINTEGTLSAECTEKQFAEFTKNKKGTIGDLWDRSKELSEKREKIYGVDPLKKQYDKAWSAKRKGKKNRKI